ncbi:hypothetical protein FUA26_00220 [Seonamhaeicola algicola]|uniref:Lipoprotein n=1 Tax=Seonamhaeicola algicola TaxID=1719036 RepID=A0A5C7B3F2_9FLAO|nr:hypothetical protein [Seonamhaeicola algicola]TXE14967.1 hypothetical protein FUA26_00220 [Seonamhaeicola algicola]
MKKTTLTLLSFLFLMYSCGDSNEESSSDETQATDEIKEESEEETNSETETCNIVNKDGLLIIEAESFNLKGKWRIIEDEKASAGKYIEYYGANSYQNQNLDHEITVKFTVDAPATYLVRWYMRQPDEAEGDKSNDVWIYFPGNIGLARINDADYTLEHYEKFVSRGKGEFTYGGALDLHNPKSSSWMRARFPEAGEYTLKICARSEFFQLDKLVLSTGMPDGDAKDKSKNLSETIICE